MYNRKRENISEKIITDITHYINKFPKINNLTIPIIYNEDYLQIIDYSCILLDKKSKKILTVIIYDKDDISIKDIISENGEILLNGFQKYYPTKHHFFYDGWNSKKKPKSYKGSNWLCGYQRYFHPVIKKQIINYHKRKSECDEQFLISQLKVYCGIYYLEKKYLPEYAKKRLELCKLSPHSPNFPIELNPSTTLGGSLNFTNKPHEDSCKSGMMEAIIFKQRSDTPYTFRNYYANVNYKILGCCVIFQDGKTLHGTLNTGEHKGIGFVNITKSNLVCNTEYTDILFKDIK